MNNYVICPTISIYIPHIDWLTNLYVGLQDWELPALWCSARPRPTVRSWIPNNPFPLRLSIPKSWFQICVKSAIQKTKPRFLWVVSILQGIGLFMNCCPFLPLFWNFYIPVVFCTWSSHISSHICIYLPRGMETRPRTGSTLLLPIFDLVLHLGAPSFGHLGVMKLNEKCPQRGYPLVN